MMHHIRQVPNDELPEVTDEETLAIRPATNAELQNHGLFRIATAQNGDGIFAIPCVDPCAGDHPGVELASGFFLERHALLDAAVRERVMRADVFRARDRRINLRRQEEQAGGETIDPGKRAPRTVRDRMRARLDQEKNNELEAEAGRGRRRPAATARTIDRVRVTMADIEDGDVVDETDIAPLSFAGEIKTR